VEDIYYINILPSFLRSRSSVSFCSILATKGINCVFAYTINFFIISLIHVRQIMRSYLLIFRRRPRHIGQFLNSIIENNSELNFSFIIKFS
jgi:hypothetical protein